MTLIAWPLAVIVTLHPGASIAASPTPIPPGFSVTGEWSYGSLPGHAGKATIYSRDAAATATWTPMIRASGPARISIFNASHPGNDPAAHIEIFHGGRTETRTVDQTKAPSGWVELGVFDVSGVGDEYVRLIAGTRHKNIRAAAMKFEFLGPAGANLWANLIIDDMTIYDPAKFSPRASDFTDIARHWAEEEIKKACAEGLFDDADVERFDPDRPIEPKAMRALIGKLKGTGTARPNAEIGGASGQALVEVFIGLATSGRKNLQWAATQHGGPFARAIALGLVRDDEIEKFETPAATRAQAAALATRFRKNILNAGPPTSKRWELTFQDGFSGEGVDWNVWKSAQGESWGKLLSARFPENAIVSDGLLRLLTKKESRGGKQWTSAFISTKAFRQRYGYWEASIRYAGAPGLNNAFWINPDRTFEIDINEGHFPHIINSTLHQQDLPSSTTRHLANVDLSLDFHTYAAEWDEDQIIFYFDGREIGRKPNAKAHAPGPVMFSTAVFGSWAGPLTDALDGKSMDVDWVRVYRRAD